MSYSDFLKKHKSCHFCAISDDEVIAETDHFIIVPARAPYTIDQLLVISKRHVVNTTEFNDEECLDLMKTLQKCEKAIYSLWYKDLSMFVRDWVANADRSWSWKSVSHFHYHILPGRDVSDLQKQVDATRVFYSMDEMKVIVEKYQKVRK